MRLSKSLLVLAVLTALAPPFAAGAQENASPAIVQALIRNGGTSLQLRLGKIYIYGLVTGGARPTSQFINGQYVRVLDSAGQLAAAIAYGTDDSNSYVTETEYHAIGGLSVAGTWDDFDAFFGSNQQSGASSASVNFTVPGDSLVVVIALASSQQSISLGGVPGLHFDAVNRGDGTEAITIAHAYLGSGVYSAREISAATAAGQDPEHMADLIGVFVLSSKNGRLGAANSLNSNYSIDTTCLPLSLHLPQIDGVEAQINRRYIRFSLNTIHYVAVQASALMPNDDADAKMDKMIFYMLNAHGTVTRLSEAETDSIKSNRELAGAILSGLANKYANIHPPSHGRHVSTPFSSSSTPTDTYSTSNPRIVQSIIQPGGTSLQLLPGCMHLYGMATGGARPSSHFEFGQFAEVINRGGFLAAELAYGADDHNQFSTTTYNHVIGGVSVTGKWNGFNAFYGSNSQPGISNASVNFTVTEEALAVFIGLAGGQSNLALRGIPGLEVDGSSSVKDGVVPVVIAHAYLQPGKYTVTGISSVWPGEPQDTPPKGDLIGVFVLGFGSKN